jgi:hypothetical protein
MARIKRYLSHNAGTGKDTGHREMTVSENRMARNWCATFGHKHWDWALDMCLDCGTTGEEIKLNENHNNF